METIITILQFWASFRFIKQDQNTFSLCKSIVQQLPNLRAHENHRVFHKMDKIFYNCVKAVKRKYKWWIIFHTLKTLLIIGLIPVDYYTLDGFKDIRMFIQFVVTAAASFVQVIMKSFYLKLTMNNNMLLLRISQHLDHSTRQIIIGDLKNIKNCVSITQYNHQYQILVSQHHYNDINATRQKQLTQSIKQQTHKKYRWIYIGKKLADILGLLSMFYAFYVLSSGLGSNWLQILVMYCEFIIEFMTQLFLIAIVLFIVFFPIILIVMALKCCANNCKCEQGWWRFKPNQQRRVLPQEKGITQSMIDECGGLCTICLQEFKLHEQVIVLKCSSKHIFHPECIQAWMDYRKTCPNCRQVIKAN